MIASTGPRLQEAKKRPTAKVWAFPLPKASSIFTKEHSKSRANLARGQFSEFSYLKQSMKKVKQAVAWILADRKRIISAVVVIILAGLVINRAVAAKKNQVQYQTAKVEKGTIISTVSASGQVITANLINITTQAGGIVKDVYVQDGDKVYSGQTLATLTLDPDSAQKTPRLIRLISRLKMPLIRPRPTPGP